MRALPIINMDTHPYYSASPLFSPRLWHRHRSTMRVGLIGDFKPCMTDIYLHIDARMADYIRTHSVNAVCACVNAARASRPPISWSAPDRLSRTRASCRRPTLSTLPLLPPPSAPDVSASSPAPPCRRPRTRLCASFSSVWTKAVLLP